MRVTIDTYNKSAQSMAEHFQAYATGTALLEITKALELAGGRTDYRVIEIGCGAGKDAAAIVKRVAWYEGFDPSEKLLDIARQHVKGASFVCTDALRYDYPRDVDIVFAFASMLHLDKNDFAAVCKKVAAALRPGGILCMTLKEADAYGGTLQEDEFGKRQFYFYNPVLVRELAGPAFTQVYETHERVGPKQKPWFTIMLKRS